MTHTIFVVDDDATQLALVKHVLEDRLGYRTITAQGGREAIERFMLRSDPQPDLMIIDLMMPDVNGLDVVRTIRRADKDIPMIMLSAYGGIHYAVDAIQAGANDFLLKPANIERLRISIQNLLQRVVLNAELERLSRRSHAQVDYRDMVGRNEHLLAAISMAKRVMDTSVPVLISGQKGTGRELLAQAMHGASMRSGAAMVSVHGVYGGPDALREALDPSHPQHAALSRGTLLVKAVDALNEADQQRLLALMTRQSPYDNASFHPRVMATSRLALEEEVRAGRFSEDLYLRLNGCVIRLPALSQRMGDMVVLAEHFIQRVCASEHIHISGMAPECKELLMRYNWPGNLRELEQTIRRAVLQCEGSRLMPMHFGCLIDKIGHDAVTDLNLGEQLRGVRSPGLMNMVAGDGNIRQMQELEAEMIRYAIKHYNGKMTEVARRLGIGRSTLYRKIQDYQLDHDQAA